MQRWVSSHGGVYVPVTEDTPPNPNLVHVKERDIETATGRQLTLMNAAYVMRQLYEPYKDVYGLKGHFTSLTPIRPENTPDSWEKNVLKS